MRGKKGLLRLLFMVFVLLVVIVFVIQNPGLTKEVGKGIAKATAWIVKGGVSVYEEANVSVNLSAAKDVFDKVKPNGTG